MQIVVAKVYLSRYNLSLLSKHIVQGKYFKNDKNDYKILVYLYVFRYLEFVFTTFTRILYVYVYVESWEKNRSSPTNSTANHPIKVTLVPTS